jgi:uncharacterized protein (TIGR02300 family)
LTAGFDSAARLWQGAARMTGRAAACSARPIFVRWFCLRATIQQELHTLIKAEWGTKRQCPKCGTRFYDLMQAEPVTCIECGNAWVPEPILKSKQSLPFEAAKTEGADKASDADLEADDIEIASDDDEPADDAVVDIGGDDDLSEVVVEKREDER